MIARAEGGSWGDRKRPHKVAWGDGTAQYLNYAAGYVMAHVIKLHRMPPTHTHIHNIHVCACSVASVVPHYVRPHGL